ncbi:MAG: hypothetical protein CEE38_00785 [Planctomycetes bacterium B3_Pla]|nr:MAG: hypothetical protein CEE38_00785 [Planctomycetes bacterium B3_Pla]
MCRKLFFLTCFAVVLTLAVSNAALGIVWEGRVGSSTDDREHYVGGSIDSAGSSDLEMPYEDDNKGSEQVVGVRFVDVAVPKGANITNAYIEFVCDELDEGTLFASLLIEGEPNPNPPAFTTDIIGRPRTTAKAVWEPADWTTVGQIDQTSDISAVIQEIVNLDGWASGNALVLIISDNPDNPSVGSRCAEAFDGSVMQAPFLHIEYSSQYATNPDPADGSLYADTWASLGWDAGETAVTHDVYISDNFDDVNDAAASAFQGNQAASFFVVGFPGMAFPDGLVPGTTYYWRVDEVEADGATKYKGSIWSFSIPSKAAYNPFPRDGAKAVDADVTLSWTGGFGAKLHSVYFGDDFDTVSNAAGGLPQGTTTHTPGTLEKDKVYYWRVDEFNPPVTIKGPVWSFRTLPDLVITDPDLIGWWKLDSVSGNTVLDWSGYGNDGTLGGDPQLVEGIIDFALDLDGDDYVAIDGVADDITSTNITLSAWIKTRQPSEGNVFAANSGGSHPLMFGVKGGGEPYVNDGGDTYFPPSINDDEWHMITYVRSGSTGTIYVDAVERGTYTAGFSLDGVDRWSIGQEWDGGPSDFYWGMVDDARFYNKALTPDEVAELTRGDPLVAWNPKPGVGLEIDVERAKQPLTWTPGDNAAEHDVYLGTDLAAVDLADADTPDIYRGRQAGIGYTPPEGLEWGTGPYYWRIDEINTDGSVSRGSIWSFTIADYILVDDIEGYTDDDGAGEAIWQSWIDGFGVPGNGSQVGNLFPPYAEKTIVHGGGQSIPVIFNNTAGVTNSEATMTLTAPRDWTIHEVGALSLWFRGYPASVGSFTEGPVGTFTITASGVDIWDDADEFHFAYKVLSGAGSIVARVDSVTNTHAWAKAGVMIRETLDPGSPNAFAAVTPGNGVTSQARIDVDGGSISSNQTGVTAPLWVKLERDVGGNFTVSHSTNGTTWEPVQGAVPNRVLMTTSVYVGLALTSHDNAATCEATFSNVTITGTVSPQWANQDIGISNNAAEPLYVALSNATGTPAVVVHDDPGAATIDVWTEWVIPLQAFADKGIDLTNVDKIAVGLGSQSSLAAAGGAGTIYFDDFRLYRQ